jgi:hypothetical protein
MHKFIPTARSARAVWPGPWVRGSFGIVLAAGCLLLWACQKGAAPGGDTPPPSAAASTASTKPQSAAPDAGAAAGAKESAAEGVTLTPEQVEKLGVATQPARTIEYREEAAGYGVIVNHDSIAQAAAELATAQATERLSRSALLRAKKLDGTPGAVSGDVEETAAQKAQVDAAALTLTTRRLSSMFGMKPPWANGGSDAALQELASGKIKLVRVTFPLGLVSGAAPASLRAAHIGANAPGTGWKMNVVWDAPADANIPGRSFFAQLTGSDAGEGERLQVWAPVGAPTSGVVIPAAAAVMSEGKYWCYVEKKPGRFERIEVDTSRPTADGYFVTGGGVGAGDQVVTAAAGQLLAKESGSSAEPD